VIQPAGSSSPAGIPASGSGRRPNQARGNGERISVERILRTMEHDWDVPIREGKVPLKWAGATYAKRSQMIRVRPNEMHPIELASHEIAHHLDNTTPVTKGLSPAAIAELQALDYDPDQQRVDEGFAEYMRTWLTQDLIVAEKAAPVFTARFKQWMKNKPEWGARIEKTRQDIDRHYGQSPMERGKAGIAFDNRPSPPLGVSPAAHVRSTISETYHQQMNEWVDDLHGLEMTERAAYRRAGYNAATVEKKMRSGTTARARAMKMLGPKWAEDALMKGNFLPTEAGLKRVGEGLPKILEEIPPAEQQDWATFLHARHAIEVWAQGKNPGMALADAKAIVDQHKHNQRWVNAADKFTAACHQLVDVMVSVGRISEEEANTIKSTYKHYVPLLRVREGDPVAVAGGMRDVKTPFKRRHGSLREIKSPVSSLVEQTILTYQAAAKQLVVNRMVSTFIKTPGAGKFFHVVDPAMQKTTFAAGEIKSQLEAAGLDSVDLEYGLDPAALLAIYRPDFAAHGKQYARIMHEGNPQLIELGPMMQQALESLDPLTLGPVATIAREATNLLKLGATGLSIPFTAKNLARDLQSFALQAKEAKGVDRMAAPLKMYGTYLASVASEHGGGKKDLFLEAFDMLGGQLSTNLGLDNHNLARVARQFTGTKKAGEMAWDWASKAIDTTRSIIGHTETPVRAAEFKASLENDGWDRQRIESAGGLEHVPLDVLIRAANAAADVTVDFKRAGKTGRYYNQVWAPFLNAMIQGTDKTARTFRDAGPAGRMLRLAIPAGLGLLMWAWRRDDDDYKEESSYLRDGYLVTPGGEHRIPLPQEYGKIAAISESLARWMADKDPEGMDQLKRQFTPEAGRAFPQATKPLVEAYFNFDMFRHREIVPAQQKDLKPEDQVNRFDDSLTQAIAKEFGVSPTKLTHVLNGYTGGLYGDLSKLTTGKTTLADYTMKGFIKPDKSRSIQDFYDTRNRMDQEAGSLELHSPKIQELKSLQKYAEASGDKGKAALIRKEMKAVRESDTTLAEAAAKTKRMDWYATKIREIRILEADDETKALRPADARHICRPSTTRNLIEQVTSWLFAIVISFRRASTAASKFPEHPRVALCAHPGAGSCGHFRNPDTREE